MVDIKVPEDFSQLQKGRKATIVLKKSQNYLPLSFEKLDVSLNYEQKILNFW